MRRVLLVLLVSLGLGVGLAQSALLFDGVAARIDTTSVAGAPANYPVTIAWVMKLTTAGLWHTIIELGQDTGPNGYAAKINDVNHIAIYSSNSGGVTQESTGTVVAGAWLFCAVSSASATSHRFYCYNYETLSVLFNETSVASLGALLPPAGGSSIGIINWGDNPLNGALAWVAVYNQDLTGNNGEALAVMAYRGPYAVRTPTLLYSFNEMAGTTVVDRRGTANIGTMSGFTSTFWLPVGLPGMLTP